jgi:hypothetical protein
VAPRSIGFCSSGFWSSRRGSGITYYFKFKAKSNRRKHAELALGFDYRTCHRLSRRREISGAGTEGLFHCGDVAMEDKDQPITDKENFPPSPEGERVYKFFAPIEQLAYRDGVIDGYRKAMLEIMLFTIIGIVCLRLAQSLSR